MKKILNHIATKMVAAALLLPLLASCSSDDDANNGGKTDGTPVTVSLNISTSDNGTRSTAGSWTAAAVNGEKMKNWFVIIAQGTAIKKIITNKKASESNPLEEETYDKFSFTAGEYDFYSFANMKLSDLGLSESSTSLSSDFDNKTFKVDGNGFDISEGFIPMSNKQTITISGSGTVNVNLWVVRMMAKVELQITNDSGSDLTLNSITLSNLTKNAAGNLKLLPNPTNNEDKKECTPNLGTVTTGDCTFGTGTGELPYFVSTTSTSDNTTTYTKQTSALTIGNGTTTNVVFYVNESATPTNNFGQFILTLNTKTASATDNSKRYALVSKSVSGTNKNASWDGEIARNDYHIIPITLDDYEFRLDIFQSEAIGVLPYWKYSDGIYTCTFYNGEEHFHIAPLIKRISDGKELEYGTGAGTWTVDETGDKASDGLPSCWQIVGTENTEIFNSKTTPTHASNNGGAPRWSTADHFAFGKFAAQSKTGKSTYKMTVTVNRDGDSPSPATRTYTYQLCIVRKNNLDEESTVTSVKRPTSATALFGYGKFLKAEQR